MPGPPTNLQIDANGNSGYNVTVRFRTPTQPNGVLRKFIVSEKIRMKFSFYHKIYS